MNAMMDELIASGFPQQSRNSKRKKPGEETVRCSARQSESAFRFKEIVVKKHEKYMQFILVPNDAKKNSLSIEAMKELKAAFSFALKDPECSAVLFNSSGTFFCSGIDISQLVGRNKKKAAEDMAKALKELVLTFTTFTKPVIAAVNGIAVGFAVTLLTFCDLVLASDKATFFISATNLGYVPEGAITLTLPQVVGLPMARELLLHGKKITADQALKHGLVTEVLWHSYFFNEVIPRVNKIVKNDLNAMIYTKIMVRCNLWQHLNPQLEQESKLLPSQWLNPKCQSKIKKALESGWPVE